MLAHIITLALFNGHDASLLLVVVHLATQSHFQLLLQFRFGQRELLAELVCVD